VTIQLPRTSRRGEIAYIKLLTRVDAFALNGFGFEGRLCRPGAAVETEDLPRPVIALECAGNSGRGRKQPTLYILWRLRDDGTWREIARAQAFDWTWAVALRTVAIRELRGPAERLPPVDLPGITARLVKSLDRELGELSREMRAHLLGGLEVELNARIAAMR